MKPSKRKKLEIAPTLALPSRFVPGPAKPKKPRRGKWKVTGHQMGPVPLRDKGVAECFYLELMPPGSQPTIFVEAYCFEPADSEFLDNTVKKIVELLNA